MFAPTRYLLWAHQHYVVSKVAHDLASSGIPYVSWPELGIAPPNVDDRNAFDALNRGIAAYNDVSVAEVVPTVGAAHGVFLAYASILSPGDEILVEQPGYEPLTRAAEGLGAVVRTFERRAEDDFRIVPERVAASMGPRTRAIVLSSLHNPTGRGTDDATIRELAAIADARGAYVIVDEIYAPFEALPENGIFARSTRKVAKNVVAIGSLTKCFGLGMYRIGWVLGPEEIVGRAFMASIATVGHLPLGHAAYGAAAFQAIGPLVKRTKSLLEGKQAIAERWVASLPNAKWSRPDGGLFGLVTLPGRGDLLPKIEERAREAGVLVCPGTFFGLPESFRLSWATAPAAEFAAALPHLEPLAR